MIDERKLLEKINDYCSEFDESLEENKSFDGYNIKSICMSVIAEILDLIQDQPKVGEWIPVEERLPEEHELIDDETGYYNKSDEVLCCCKNEYNEFEYWIDYTIDGEWQYSEYIDGDEKYWQPLPEDPRPYSRGGD